MVYLINYEFKSLTENILKPEESFINFYVDECLKSNITTSSTRRMRIIVDAKYEKDDLNKFMTEKFQHLIPSEQESLLNYLFIEYLFDGTLGMWNTAPMELELKGGTNTVCSQPYPVPRLHEATCRKEVERLLKIGVLKESNDSEWGAPSFSQPKSKTNRIRFLSDFRNLNRQLKRKPYPMPKTWELISNLEVF